MKILITGGAGFIGSHLVDYCLARNDEVVVIDNLETGSLDNIRLAMENPKFELIKADIADLSSLDSAVKWAECVYHLAAIVGMFKVMENPLKAIKTNLFGTEYILRYLSSHQRIIIVSSSEVYDLKPSLRFNYVRWNYALSKLMSEALSLSYARECDFDVKIARIFNTIGTRQTGSYGMVVPRFVQQAVEGKPITVYGDGTQRRCFIAVENMVKMLYGLMLAPVGGNETFDVGIDRSISIFNLAKLIKMQTESDSPIVFVPYKEAYPKEYVDVHSRIPNLNAINVLLKNVGIAIVNNFEDVLGEIIKEKRNL